MGPYFNSEFFDFLKQLKRNNRREWFAKNKARFESVVRDPCLRFITEAAEPLHTISAQIVADPRPNGGSLFRIYRDIRFSENKQPYKTHIGIQFRHAAEKKDVHAPRLLFPHGARPVFSRWRIVAAGIEDTEQHPAGDRSQSRSDGQKQRRS